MLVFDTYPYCLLPNHFHLLVHVKDSSSLTALEDLEGFWKPSRSKGEVSTWLAHRVGSFQNAYAKAYNKYYERRGPLFMQRFGRKLIQDDAYFMNVVRYIHFNPVYHGIVKDIRDWKYTSYHAYLSSQPSYLARYNVIDYFGSVQHFKHFHMEPEEIPLTMQLTSFY